MISNRNNIQRLFPSTNFRKIEIYIMKGILDTYELILPIMMELYVKKIEQMDMNKQDVEVVAIL